MIKVISRTESTIEVEIYSNNENSIDNEFYVYKDDQIQHISGTRYTELVAIAEDVIRQVWSEKGIENYNVTLNNNHPSDVNYVVHI